MKPVNMDRLLEVVNRYLSKQQEEEKYSEKRVTEYMETRAKEFQGDARPR